MIIVRELSILLPRPIIDDAVLVKKNHDPDASVALIASPPKKVIPTSWNSYCEKSMLQEGSAIAEKGI